MKPTFEPSSTDVDEERRSHFRNVDLDLRLSGSPLSLDAFHAFISPRSEIRLVDEVPVVSSPRFEVGGSVGTEAELKDLELDEQ